MNCNCLPRKEEGIHSIVKSGWKYDIGVSLFKRSGVYLFQTNFWKVIIFIFRNNFTIKMFPSIYHQFYHFMKHDAWGQSGLPKDFYNGVGNFSKSAPLETVFCIMGKPVTFIPELLNIWWSPKLQKNALKTLKILQYSTKFHTVIVP